MSLLWDLYVSHCAGLRLIQTYKEFKSHKCVTVSADVWDWGCGLNEGTFFVSGLSVYSISLSSIPESVSGLGICTVVQIAWRREVVMAKRSSQCREGSLHTVETQR